MQEKRARICLWQVHTQRSKGHHMRFGRAVRHEFNKSLEGDAAAREAALSRVLSIRPQARVTVEYWYVAGVRRHLASVVCREAMEVWSVGVKRG